MKEKMTIERLREFEKKKKDALIDFIRKNYTKIQKQEKDLQKSIEKRKKSKI